METVALDIDLSALKHNMKVIKTHVPKSKIIAVVKANAYGHGSVECSKAMDEYVKAYAVARVEEGIELRDAGITKPIILLGGVAFSDDLELCHKYDLSFTIHSYPCMQMLEKFAASHPNYTFKVWCQVNIGMQRLGFNENEIADAMERIKSWSFVVHPVGMMSHLSCADEEAVFSYNEKQKEAFKRFSKYAEGPLCLANSAGCLYHEDTHTEWVRPGIIQYGVSPTNNKLGSDFDLEPVMTLKTVVTSVRELQPGDTVGYGASWVCEKATRIAILGVGYADGYPRMMPNGSPVLLNGKMVKTVGHVCMDMMFVDIGDLTVKPGDQAILWGKGLPVELVASKVPTIAYELLTRPTKRVKYNFIGA